MRNLLAVPGGHVEGNEDVKASLKPEIKEETGLNVENLRLLSASTARPKDYERDTRLLYIRYICETASTGVEQDLDEATDHVLTTPGETLSMNIYSSIKEFIREYMDFTER